jgi:glycosyltransferase involved in cell wall biosynthesis
MPNNPSVSVIIPTYNRARFVTAAIDSVLAQTYKDYEITVVDDGSTDNTREVLKPYMDRIRYIYQENSGVSHARNVGIRDSTGQLIAFLDSDDRWLPDKLQVQMEFMQKNGLKVCFTDVHSQRDPSDQIQITASHASDERIYTEPLELILDDALPNVIPTLLVDRDVLFRVGCFDERVSLGEDNFLAFRLAFEGPFGFIQKPCVIIDRVPDRRRLTRDSLGGLDLVDGSLVSILMRLEAYVRSRRKDKRIVKKLRYLLAEYFADTAVLHCLDNNSSDARRFAWDGLHFARSYLAYRRCLSVLLCPCLVRRISKANERQRQLAKLTKPAHAVHARE